MTASTSQLTDFTRDVLGRYVCNGLDEALHSADPGATRPDGSSQVDAKPFDVIVIGGGSFGPIFAEHVFAADKTHSHRVLVLEGGPLSLPEHVQNMPMIGLGVPSAVTSDPGPRAEVWGLPWRSDVAFPGLAYTLGGRSVFFGGWAPELLESETTSWPAALLTALRSALPDGSDGYFRQASQQIGVTQTNDFVFGKLHEALRQRVFDGIQAGSVEGAIALNSPDLPLHLDGIPAAQRQIAKLEAPLAVQGRAPRSGFFPLNKFSSVPLIMQAARTAATESAGDDVKKRFMIAPNCHVIRLETEPTATGIRVVNVLTSKGSVPVAANACVVIATGTVESARLALTSFPALPNAGLVGTNLMAHLRSNLTIRIPTSSLPAGLGNELQASALFVKGRHTFADATKGHFHLQITAAGLEKPSGDSEAELFKKNPDIDLFTRFSHATDTTVVITIRGIGEMAPHNPDSHVTLDGELDEYHVPRARVTLKPSAKDNELWDAMDRAADDLAKVLADGKPYHVFLGASAFAAAAVGQSAVALLAFAKRRDGLGTTHHEAGTLWMGDDPATSVTDSDGRFHHVDNAYVAGPALHPSVGSPNPMLTGTALARRLADTLARRPAFVPEAGFQALFDGSNAAKWRMSTIRNQPGRDNPGRFIVVDGGLEAVTGSDLGLYWHTDPTPPDFVLKLQWRRFSDDDNSGVLLRFPDPDSKGYDNTAFVATDFGFEVQIDQLARNDGAAIHKTAAIYGLVGPTDPANLPVNAPGEWNQYEIRVQGQVYDVLLNGSHVTHFVNPDANRGLPSTAAIPSFIGLQTHTGRVGFRDIQIKAL
ncbi:MAG: family 16 glycoside hydrolase [Solirubrobacteraceae bacterium]